MPEEGEHPVQRNVSAVAEIEAALLGERSTGDHLTRVLIRRMGTAPSVALHASFYLAWVALNAAILPGKWRFDPAPFPLLELIASVEAIMLALLILASQRRLQQEQDQRAHLGLQVSMLTEREATKMLHMLEQLSARLGVRDLPGEDIEALKADTDPHSIVETLKSSIPEER